MGRTLRPDHNRPQLHPFSNHFQWEKLTYGCSAAEQGERFGEAPSLATGHVSESGKLLAHPSLCMTAPLVNILTAISQKLGIHNILHL